MIKELEEDREESQDPEVEFAIAGAVQDYGGLEILLGMIQVSFLYYHAVENVLKQKIFFLYSELFLIVASLPFFFFPFRNWFELYV